METEELSIEDLSLYSSADMYHNPPPPPGFLVKQEVEESLMRPPPKQKSVKQKPSHYTTVTRIKVPKSKEILPKSASDLVNENWSTYGDEFHCNVCQLTLNSVSTYDAHMQGRKHSKMVKEASKLQTDVNSEKAKYESVQFGADAIRVNPEPVSRRPIILDQLEKTVVPCVGLQYVTEIVRLDVNSDPIYVCSLCNITCQLVSIIPHVVGQKHRLQFLKKDLTLAYETLKKEQKKDCHQRYLEEFEQIHGRQSVIIKMEIAASLEGGVKRKKSRIYDVEDISQINSQALSPRQHVDLFKTLVNDVDDHTWSKKQYVTLYNITENADEMSIKHIMKKATKEEKYQFWVQNLASGNVESFFKAFHRPPKMTTGEDLRICVQKLVERNELEIETKKGAKKPKNK